MITLAAHNFARSLRLKEENRPFGQKDYVIDGHGRHNEEGIMTILLQSSKNDFYTCS